MDLTVERTQTGIMGRDQSCLFDDPRFQYFQYLENK
jgi:hypothetical protein